MRWGAHGDVLRWDYYETIGGGTGAHVLVATVFPRVHSHMTNTLNTPIESLETHYPLRVRRYELRVDSGGTGRFNGGDGIVREFEFLEPAAVTLLTERRRRGPWGLGGRRLRCPRYRTCLNGRALPAKVAIDVGRVMS